MKLFLLGLTLLIFAPYALAQSPVPLSTEEEILRQVFTLREELGLPKLARSSTLDRIARRSAEANLQREGHIEHTDSEGKTLGVRSLEEAYSGSTGEIVGVVYRMCPDSREAAGLNDRILGEKFKVQIRNSPPHYLGLTSQVGREWNEYGVSILHHHEIDEGICMDKTTLSLVVGRHNKLP